MSTLQVKKIFNEKVKFIQAGADLGDCHPAHEGGIDKIMQVRDILAVDAVFAPSLNFTNQVAAVHETEKIKSENHLLRTKDKADGGIVAVEYVALMICNADCHIGLIYYEKKRLLTMLHLGLNCFFRQDGSPSILENAIAALKADPKDLKLWVGAGIGPCCNGYNFGNPQTDKIRQLFLNCVGGEIKKGPRRGQESYNNIKMILQQAYDLGFRHLEFDDACTSCAGVADDESNEIGTYFSNVRDLSNPKNNFRNCFMAALV